MPDVSNVIKLFADNNSCTKDYTSSSGNMQTESPTLAEHSAPTKQLEYQIAANSGSLSLMPQSHRENEVMVEIETRLYCYPAIAQATAFRYESTDGRLSFGATVVFFDWSESVTAADIKKWITNHLDASCLPVEIIQLDSAADY